MLIDAFMFFNELDTLELRLLELKDEVDFFVLLESGETLAGVKKPFFFDEHRNRFDKYLKKIRHIKLPGLPPLAGDTEVSRFWLESFQRNALMLGLVGQGIKPSDVVMISDVDEIPSACQVRQMAKSIAEGEVWVFAQKLFYYYFDHKLDPKLSASPWLGTAAVHFSELGRLTPEQIRRDWAKAAEFLTEGHHKDTSRHIVSDGGWHLSYFGGKSAQSYKMANFSHGAGGVYGDANFLAPVSIERSTVSGLKELDSILLCELQEIASNKLMGNLPSGVIKNLESYYHHFEVAYRP